MSGAGGRSDDYWAGYRAGRRAEAMLRDPITPSMLTPTEQAMAEIGPRMVERIMSGAFETAARARAADLMTDRARLAERDGHLNDYEIEALEEMGGRAPGG